MPKGPKGERRPADVIGAAVKVMRIATGEETEAPAKPKNAAKSAAGKKGGAARMAPVDPQKRREIAQKAAASRWAKKR
jgi:hypothetical protein